MGLSGSDEFPTQGDGTPTLLPPPPHPAEDLVTDGSFGPDRTHSTRPRIAPRTVQVNLHPKPTLTSSMGLTPRTTFTK